MNKKMEDLLREVIFILNGMPNTGYWYKEERTDTYKLVDKIENVVYKRK